MNAREHASAVLNPEIGSENAELKCESQPPNAGVIAQVARMGGTIR